jgi:hypothetical protein
MPGREVADMASERPADDLLSGFTEPGERKNQLRAYLTTTIVASLYVFDTAFYFGAYHSVNFHQIQHITVVSLVIVMGVLFVRRQLRVHLWVLVLLAPPILLFFYRLATPEKHQIEVVRLTDNALVIVNTVVLPVIGWIVARLLAPDYFGLPGWRLKIAVIATVVVVASLGYVNGRFNYRSLTCEDFITAGDKPPANCMPYGHP